MHHPELESFLHSHNKHANPLRSVLYELHEYQIASGCVRDFIIYSGFNEVNTNSAHPKDRATRYEVIQYAKQDNFQV